MNNGLPTVATLEEDSIKLGLVQFHNCCEGGTMVDA